MVRPLGNEFAEWAVGLPQVTEVDAATLRARDAVDASGWESVAEFLARRERMSVDGEALGAAIIRDQDLFGIWGAPGTRAK